MTSPEPASPPADTIRVLIVDDTDVLRGIIRGWFERHEDFTVVAEARDGREGIEAAAEYEPDLIMLDLQMRGMSGTEALPILHRDHPKTRIVIFTGHDAIGNRDYLLEQGASEALGKGLKPQEVIAAVRALF